MVLKGIALPFGGLSWDNNINEKDRIQFLFTYLESKRVLYDPSEMERKEWCITSVLEIKSSLVEINRDIKISTESLKVINSMIDTCNNFLNNVNKQDSSGIIYNNCPNDFELFYQSMKKFRDNMKYAIEYFERVYNIKFRKELSETW